MRMMTVMVMRMVMMKEMMIMVFKRMYTTVHNLYR